MLVSTAQNEEEGALKEATEKAEDVHPSKDVIIAGVQNPLGFVPVPNVKDIAEVLVRLKIADSSLEKGIKEQEEGRKEKPS